MAAARARICKGCWQQLHLPVPLHGVASVPFRLFGIRPSKMNPNTCTICELMFKRIMKARKVTVDVTVMFADLRGYTTLSRSSSADRMSSVLDDFYDECAEAIWAEDGLLNKTIGDAVMAIFNFPIQHPDHAERAVRAAREIRRRCELHLTETGESDAGYRVGIGIDSGEASFGEFGRSHRDLTAIGTVVNTAARAQAAAESGRILVTRSVRERAPSAAMDSVAGSYDLKGFDEPVELHAL